MIPLGNTYSHKIWAQLAPPNLVDQVIPGGTSVACAREKNEKEEEWGLAGVEEEAGAHWS